MTGSGQQQLCTFRVERMLLGIRVSDIQEVVLPQEMTSVPLTSDCIRGLINLRGQIVTAIDIRLLFGLPPAGPRHMNIIANVEDDTISCMVDSVGEVMTVLEDAFEPPPLTLPDDLRKFLMGAYKLEGRLLLLLDTEKVADRAAAKNA